MLIVKDIFDRVAALFGLVCLLPLFAVIYIVIAATDRSAPVIFRQQRVGRHGRLFTIYKFRTMTAGHGGSSVSVAGESRITPLGAVLRRWKLDELPELWNVLVGDMSFVGPRPDVPGYADKLQGDDRLVLTLKPGITGPASLKYRNEEQLLAMHDDPQKYNDEVIFPDKVRLNLYYATHYSFITDIKMILCTVSGRHMQYAGETI